MKHTTSREALHKEERARDYFPDFNERYRERIDHFSVFPFQPLTQQKKNLLSEKYDTAAVETRSLYTRNKNTYNLFFPHHLPD